MAACPPDAGAVGAGVDLELALEGEVSAPTSRAAASGLSGRGDDRFLVLLGVRGEASGSFPSPRRRPGWRRASLSFPEAVATSGSCQPDPAAGLARRLRRRGRGRWRRRGPGAGAGSGARRRMGPADVDAGRDPGSVAAPGLDGWPGWADRAPRSARTAARRARVTAAPSGGELGDGDGQRRRAARRAVSGS